jgi:hypothetical protein
MGEGLIMPERTLNADRLLQVVAVVSGADDVVFRKAAVLKRAGGRKRGPLARLWRWVTDQVVGEVPEESALCEFDCRKGQCEMGEWTSCERRLRQANAELWPSAQDPKSDPEQ